jgi:hypothetical protein
MQASDEAEEAANIDEDKASIPLEDPERPP